MDQIQRDPIVLPVCVCVCVDLQKANTAALKLTSGLVAFCTCKKENANMIVYSRIQCSEDAG